MFRYYEISDLIDGEIGCIESGNKLTPHEQSIVIESLENLRRRICGKAFDNKEKKDE